MKAMKGKTTAVANPEKKSPPTEEEIEKVAFVPMLGGTSK